MFALTVVAQAQDAAGSLEGHISDRSGAIVAKADVVLKNIETNAIRSQASDSDGLYRFVQLPVGRYLLTVEAPGFARFSQSSIEITVSQTSRVDVPLSPASVTQSVVVTDVPAAIDTSTNTLGKVVSGREVLDLPLNGRNFAQLGLLQTGVAPLSSGVITEGGSLRQGQSYAVNGQRPEGNNFLLDGAQNVNRMDGGFALKIPIDAIAEFRILTNTAPPEYGGNTGSTTSVVTRAGGNDIHGTIYEFFRNDALDTRNYFSSAVEPLKQNQFGATAGGPLRKDRLFAFAYYEGFRNRQGITTSATVPTAAEQRGDFSGIGHPLINFAAGGIPYPNNQIPTSDFNKVAVNAAALYPNGNVSPSVYTATVVGTNDDDQTGIRLDYHQNDKSQFFSRYSYFTGYNINPVSVRGSDLPGYPTRDDSTAHSFVGAHTYLLSSRVTNAFEASFFRYEFLFDQRLNKTPPRALGFDYDSASLIGEGPPFFNVSGYSPVGGAITGPRTSVQNTYEVHDGLSLLRGNHGIKVGAEFRRNQLNLFQSIAPNAFFIFASSFPTNDAFANLLLGSPVVFYQGRGDFTRYVRNWGAGFYYQDEWHAKSRFTVNYGLRYEIINPNTETRNRLNAFVPGVQSHIMPTAPTGLLFPGDPGVSRGIAPSYYKGFMPRAGFVWDPTGKGRWSVRSAYGIFYDPFANGMGVTSQGPISSLPWAQFVQITPPTLNFAAPYSDVPIPAANTFVKPSTPFVMDTHARPTNAQDWNLSVQREVAKNYVLEVRYVGTKGTHLPRNIDANPAVYGPGATAQNADHRRIYANCPVSGRCDYATIAELTYGQNSTYHAAQLSFSRQVSDGLGFNVSYWYSKTLDYLSSMNLQGASAKALGGENDLAQNPFDLKAEHGPSLFDARHRFVASGTWVIPFAHGKTGMTGQLFDGWQFNLIAIANSATPFTVYDSANVSLQASAPPISGYFASRPDVVSNPNHGPHTVARWIDPSNFQRLNPTTQAGQFGDAGRNIARGPASADVDLSAIKNFRVAERVSLQFRAESFNIANHANFGLPIADIASTNFGRILSAGPPRLMQFALKAIF
ncbi:MAG: carboxypeptidase regulatory-like domain-containing protein [Candidatus Sulfotelmatobacter sp.]